MTSREGHTEPLISIIIPTFKEREIGETLERLDAHLATIGGHRFEVLLVDDSPPGPKQGIQRAIEEREARSSRDSARDVAKVHVVLMDGNRKGKGNAVKAGALVSRGEIVFTMDADLPVPLEHVSEFLRILESGAADIVIAERPLSRNLSSPVRFVLSRGLFFLNRAIIFQSNEFLDTQCGFKAFRRHAIRALAAEQIVDGGMYDTEYLYAATKKRLRVAKVRVVPNVESRASKINVLKCLATDPVDLLRVKVKGVTGGYQK